MNILGRKQKQGNVIIGTYYHSDKIIKDVF